MNSSINNAGTNCHPFENNVKLEAWCVKVNIRYYKDVNMKIKTVYPPPPHKKHKTPKPFLIRLANGLYFPPNKQFLGLFQFFK